VESREIAAPMTFGFFRHVVMLPGGFFKREGRPSEKIVETAKQGNFDIIVLGSQGLGGIKKFFLGSVSHRVADEATCPVLIIK